MCTPLIPLPSSSISLLLKGNFVVQHVLEHGTAAERHEVVEVIHGDVQRLARHRVASHVVRCALKHSGAEDRQRLVQAIRRSRWHRYLYILCRYNIYIDIYTDIDRYIYII